MACVTLSMICLNTIFLSCLVLTLVHDQVSVCKNDLRNRLPSYIKQHGYKIL